MNPYRVIFYRQPKGTRGSPDRVDYGIYTAPSEDEAKEKALDHFVGKEDKDRRTWVKEHLITEKVA